MAWKRFQNLRILTNQEFDYVDWEMVYEKLQDVPRLFQLWTFKQVMGATWTMEWDKTSARTCPSCMVARDMYAHVLFCCHKGRVEMFRHPLDLMEEWLEEAENDPDLLDCIAKYAHGQGERTMTKICSSLRSQFIQTAKEQDAIGWRYFMEGVICRSTRKIQYNFHYWEGTKTNPNRWAQGMILKLLKATHGQWRYCNIQIHDAVTGTQVTLQKEAIQREIEEQIEVREAGLL